ncbi:hypothetical protein NKR23_g532 [Pleurostoma richardsiae]|uniref:Uncharacterized protein n=1 Tax=Pleurostoma richardsiae TaxID=41990 RepID=A0AA38RVA3_9PEZI|nr:hypothetical protein NKR23_g532 [Pleurostoma richardsiae]
MHGLKEVLCSIERFQARYRVACQASKVASCGGMTGCAVLFPIAEADGYRYSSLLLSVFVWSIFVFHTLHLECYVKYGPHTVFLAFLLLLLLVWIPGGTTLTEFIPWLPLYAVLVSLATVALSTFLRRRNEPQTDLDSSWSAGRGREDPEGLSLNFMQGPRSQYSGQSSSDGTGDILPRPDHFAPHILPKDH